MWPPTPKREHCRGGRRAPRLPLGPTTAGSGLGAGRRKRLHNAREQHADARRMHRVLWSGERRCKFSAGEGRARSNRCHNGGCNPAGSAIFARTPPLSSSFSSLLVMQPRAAAWRKMASARASAGPAAWMDGRPNVAPMCAQFACTAARSFNFGDERSLAHSREKLILLDFVSRSQIQFCSAEVDTRDKANQLQSARFLPPPTQRTRRGQLN